MNMQKEQEERLWDYIDGGMAASEKSAIENLLETNADWKAKYNELMELHHMVQTTELDAPSLRFGKNVMEKIARLHIAPAAKIYINKKIIWSLGFFFMALILGFLVYGFAQMDWKTPADSGISKTLNKIDINKFFSNTWVNVFMMINVVLGLFLLDNFLTQKRKSFRKEA